MAQGGAQTVKAPAIQVPDEILHVVEEFLEVLNGLGGASVECESFVHVTELSYRPYSISSMSKFEGNLKRKVTLIM